MPEASSRRSHRHAWYTACALDVAVRKPGHVSVHSDGHRMQAWQFLASAAAAALPITEPGATVGARIESAIAATWQAVGCNTNLGIVLLAAPLLHAIEQVQAEGPASTWTQRLDQLEAATDEVFRALTRDDAQRAFRAIAKARPAGLGTVDDADVHDPAQVSLREAMALAADRDRIAALYASGGHELFERVRLDWAGCADAGPLFTLWLPPSWIETHAGVKPGGPGPALPVPPPPLTLAMQTSFLRWLAQGPDSHLVRKHGLTVGQRVSAQARDWLALGGPPGHALQHTAWATWDEALKRSGWNPGTTADLCVACALVTALVS